ncbi:unnamed protein product [Dicrocoelium dendriticum]|nr:unnamed protein product [Dicrocoelium dendriticum]
MRQASIYREKPFPPKTSDTVTSPKRGGILTVVLPLYGVGIAIYLIYTLSRVYKSRQRHKADRKDEFLRHYYRGFHYDVNRGKFRMGHGSSDEDSCLPEDEGDWGLLSQSFERTGKHGHSEQNEAFDWTSIDGTDCPNIYRSAKTLPRDLEALLKELESPDKVDTDGLSALRARLEKTEHEMTQLLRTMDQAEHYIGRFSNEVDMSASTEHYATTPAFTEDDSDIGSDIEVTASEGEVDALELTSSVNAAYT